MVPKRWYGTVLFGWLSVVYTTSLQITWLIRMMVLIGHLIIVQFSMESSMIWHGMEIITCGWLVQEIW